MTTRQPPSFLNQTGRGKRITARDEFPDLPIDPRTGVIPDPDAPDDLEPLADGMQQENLFLDTNIVMREFFRERHGALVSGNTPLYYLDEAGRRRIVYPDCYIALGIDPIAIRRRNGYFIDAVGQPPSVVIEIASVSTTANDLGPKRELYARLGVGEYWRFDATGGDFYGEPLVGETLVDGEYIRLPIETSESGLPRIYSPTLDLEVYWNPGRMDFYDPVQREFLPLVSDLAAELRSQYQARRAAEEQASAEQTARRAAEAEVERLREQVRRLQEGTGSPS